MLAKSCLLILLMFLLSACAERINWVAVQYGDKILWCREAGRETVAKYVCFDSPLEYRVKVLEYKVPRP